MEIARKGCDYTLHSRHWIEHFLFFSLFFFSFYFVTKTKKKIERFHSSGQHLCKLPISLTSVSCKIMQYNFIYRHIINHLDSNSIIIHYQHGFTQRHSRETQLIAVLESLGGNLDLGQQSDLLLFDISKAFDTVLTDDCWINKISTEFMEISRHGSNNG